LLSEYAAVSGGQIIVTFVNPDDEAKQQAARADGVQPVAHQKIEEDQVAVVEGYRGMVLHYLDETRTIPVIQDTMGLEYIVTSAIKELVGERKPVGIVGGHAGPSLAQGLTSLKSVLKLYDVREVDATQEIDTGLAALLIIGPQEPFSGRSVDSRLDGLLSAWGVRLVSKIVADAQCSRAPMRGPMGFQVLVPYPPIPLLQLTEEQLEHPVMFRLASPMLPFVAPLEVSDAPAGVQITVLASSSQDSWTMSGPTISLEPRNPRDWQMTSDAGPFTLMVAIEGELPSAYVAPMDEKSPNAIQAPTSAEGDVRVLVSGTSSEDAFMPPPTQQGDIQMNAALALALNAIDWLAADSDLIAIRAKTVEEPALDIPDSVLAAENTARAAAEEGDQEGVNSALGERRAAIASWDAKKRAYRWVNTLGIPFLVALFGLFRWRQRSNKKKTLKL
ncbi:MAG: GldG family protein, partial [Deltaproteobacteria bacterium]|nr:GldG family protein [Deltaproteobacteria bacterium]